MPVDKAPFDAEGNLLEYDGYGVAEWRDNVPFRATLTYAGFERGRSAARLIWEDDGRKYPMFLSTLDKILSGSGHDIGTFPGRPALISGVWHVVKRGANYGIAPKEDK